MYLCLIGVSNGRAGPGRAVNRRPAAQLGPGRAREKSSARGPAYEPAGWAAGGLRAGLGAGWRAKPWAFLNKPKGFRNEWRGGDSNPSPHGSK